MVKKNTAKSNTDHGKTCLRALLEECDPNKLVDFFKGMPEEERKDYASLCMDWLKNRWDYFQDLHNNPLRQKDREYLDGQARAINPEWDNFRLIRLCTDIGAVATAELRPLRGAKRNWELMLAKHDDFLIPVLKKRSPEKILAILELACADGHDIERDYWLRYRRLVGEKIVKSSLSDRWIGIMFNAMLYDSDTKRFSSGKSIVSQLLDDPDLLKNEVWKIFEATDFPGKWNYSDADREHRWKDAIVELIAQGKLDKKRVVDCCFKALDRPETDHRLRWFVRLLERMPFDAKETELYFKRFLDLALHPEPTPRTLGLQYFEQGFKASKINDSDALTYLAIALREPSKAKAKKGLAVLETIFKRSHKLASRIISMFIDCLGHEQTEVQQAAADFLLTKVDVLNEEQKKKIEQMAESSEPSVKRSLNSLFSTETPKNTESKKAGLVKVVTDKTCSENITGPPAVQPILTVAELTDAVLRYITTDGDAEELERLVDAIARLHNDRDDNFERLTQSIRKKHNSGYGFYLINLVECWLTRRIRQNGKDVAYDKTDEMYKDMIRRHGFRDSNGTIYTGRMDYVLERMDQFEAFQLLSAPAHRHFLIDPLILAERIQSLEDDFNEQGKQDRLLAILRLGKWNRKEAIASLKKIKAKGKRREYIDAVRYALGDDVDIGLTVPYWVAASRVRDPEARDEALLKKHPQLGVGLSYPPERKAWLAFHKGGDEVYQYESGFVSEWTEKISVPKPGQDYPTALHYLQGERRLWSSLSIGIYLSTWPMNIRLFYHKMAGIMAARLHSKSNVPAGVYPLSIMSERWEPVGVEGALLLAAGVATAQANVNSAAVDAMIQCISQDRLSPDEMTVACRELLKFLEPAKKNKVIAELVVKPGRWTKPFKTISQESPKHAIFIRDLLESILPNLPERDLGGFVELLYELCLETETKLGAPCRVFLKSTPISGKAAKLTKKLLGE